MRFGWRGIRVESLRSKIKIASDIYLVFYSSTITMMHGAINIRFKNKGTRRKRPPYFNMTIINNSALFAIFHKSMEAIASHKSVARHEK